MVINKEHEILIPTVKKNDITTPYAFHKGRCDLSHLPTCEIKFYDTSGLWMLNATQCSFMYVSLLSTP